ncbi:Zn-dependent alcohol dehydrogenase [Subtercola sp. Z020]|uniref:zinc-dependent alcohol dehydrogenase n=1 Tax=Subtercola sp. Z020 TaxID=2080582 RepID=UPI000CE73A39|nr:alcohol dehydrogenase catalytic domain-containing protein [Subtercola sp. Z020]PPF81297.1 Zn-dependent alcohol dehydrogenase [Subtercola sp. Z020]
MLSATYEGPRTVATTEYRPVPPAEGEVQIAVAFVGLCGTDLHVYHGDMAGRVSAPAVLGHEMSGVVVALGSGVSDVAVGDQVTVMPLSWDGTCPACLAGNTHICQNLDFIGVDTSGALQQRWNVPAGAVIPLPAGLGLQDAALTEPVAVAVHDVRRSGLGAGDSVVVIGAGPIGTLISLVARTEGAHVTVIELDAERRRQVEELGFDTLDAARSDLVEEITAKTGGAGADVVFEVSGSAAGAATATSYAKVRGTVVIVAIHPQPRPLDLHRVFWRELRILGARVYQRTDFERALELLTAGEIPTGLLITQVFELADVASAFEALAGGTGMKLLVDVSSAENADDAENAENAEAGA